MRRTELQRGTKQLTRRQSLQASSFSRSPVKGREVALRQRSKKKQRRDKGYALLRVLVFARAEGLCKCCGQALDPEWWDCHHVLPRSHGGEDSMGNCIALTPDCHKYVHTHPDESYERGLLLRSNHQGAAA